MNGRLGAMSLNIKNEKVHDLARAAARLTGKSQTAVIAEALEHYLALLQVADEAEVRRQGLRALFDEWDRNPLTEDERAAMTIAEEDLYDPVTGLPA